MCPPSAGSTPVSRKISTAGRLGGGDWRRHPVGAGWSAAGMVGESSRRSTGVDWRGPLALGSRLRRRTVMGLFLSVDALGASAVRSGSPPRWSCSPRWSCRPGLGRRGWRAAPASCRAAPAGGVSVAGGDVLRGAGGTSCQLGFNLSGRGILAGAQCGPVGTRWSAGTVPVGVTVVVTQTAALIYIDNPAVSQIAGRRVGAAIAPVTAAARAYVGQQVSYYSATLGARIGTVTGINQTVAYPQGTITGLDRTNLCVSPRDPGAPVVAGTTGLSIVLGGGSCPTGVGFAQPITPLLSAWGRTLY